MSTAAPAPAAFPSSPSFPWNFGAGPGALPPTVLAEAAANLQHHGGPFPHGAGISVMCMSHRSPTFESIMASAERNCRSLLSVPDTHAILFLQGGGTGGFAQVPLNLAQPGDTVSYAITGTWSSLAAKEAAKFANLEVLVDSKDADGGYTIVPDASTWKPASPDSKYLHLCYNETQQGTVFPSVPSAAAGAASLPLLVADFSSCFMSEPIDISRFAVVYAGAHKNVGPVGVTIYIIRRDLLAPPSKPSPVCPAVFDWRLFAASNSMYNTPCTWSVYVMNLMFEWIKEQGGVAGMERASRAKSQLIYDAIDQSGGFYATFVQDKQTRSRTNICFNIPKGGASAGPIGSDKSRQDAVLQARFVAESEAAGFVGLAGHRNTGAIRASVYNGMPLDGCQALVQFMRDFQKRAEAEQASK